jgi:signal transduction histidine kinase
MEGTTPVLYVRDNGAGMDAKQLTRITEPFYRTDRSRSRSEGGTGLGLSLCAKIADAHGAVLSFSSAVGEGTEAKVVFAAKKEKTLTTS